MNIDLSVQLKFHLPPEATVIRDLSMPDEMQNISSIDVTFIRKLKKSIRSAIFHVVVRGKGCVMKVVSETVTQIILDLKQLNTVYIGCVQYLY